MFRIIKHQIQRKMKKLLLLLLIVQLPGYLFAQIAIKGTTYTLLTEAIAASVSGDTIRISGPVTLTEQVELSHASGVRTIRGMTANASIKLANGARFIVSGAGETAFADITVIGADEANPDWGAMFTLFNGPTLLLKNDTIRGAKTDAHAGAIRITNGATVRATNTVFRDNQANQNGGVAFIEAGNTETIFDGCVFIGNKCGTNNPDAKGGALFYAQGANEKDHIVRNSAFIHNESSNHWGAVGMETVSPEFINCTFSGNMAADNGGSIWMWNGSGASKTTVVNCTFYGNTAGNGSALFMNQAVSQYDVANSVFAENGATPFGFGEPVTIVLRNSYFPALPQGLTVNGTGNLNEGEIFLAGLNMSEGIFYHNVTSYESVLIALGSTNLLRPYGRTDQIGFERNMNLPTITAGSIEYSGKGDPIMGLENPGRHNLLPVYPNPASHYIIISAERTGKIGIYDLKGTLMVSESVAAGENHIDISALPKSIYAVRNESGNGITLGRFTKQ
jgi:hypothetical protein